MREYGIVPGTNHFTSSSLYQPCITCDTGQDSCSLVRILPSTTIVDSLAEISGDSQNYYLGNTGVNFCNTGVNLHGVIIGVPGISGVDKQN